MQMNLTRLFFLGGSSSDDLWFPCFLSEKICRGYYVIFPNYSLILILEYIIVISSAEEPSKIFPALNEWPLSSVGRGTLQGGTGSNPAEALIFLQDSLSVQLRKLQFNYEDHCSVFLIVCSFLQA